MATSRHSVLCTGSGSLAILAAILRASSFVSNLAAMSALPPKADIGTQSRNVRLVPEADIMQCNKLQPIRSLRQRGRAEIDHERKLVGSSTRFSYRAIASHMF